MRYSIIILLLGFVFVVQAQDDAPTDYAVITPENVTQLEEIMHWNVSEDSGHSAALNPAGDTVVLALGDGLIRLVDVTIFAEIMTLDVPDFVQADLQFSQDGERIALLTSSRSVRVWDVATGTLLFAIDDISLDTAFHIDSNLTTFGVLVDTNLLLEDILDSETNLVAFDDLDIQSFAIGYDGEQVLLSTIDAWMLIYDTQASDVIYTFESPIESDRTSIGFSKDGQFVWGSWQDWRINREDNPSVIHIWDNETSELVYTLEDEGWGYSRIAFSPDAETVTVMGQDEFLVEIASVWELSTETEIAYFSATGGAFVSYSYDGQMIALQGGTDATMYFNEISLSTTHLHELIFVSGLSIPPQFSPDGRFLLTAHVDGVRLWAVPMDGE